MLTKCNLIKRPAHCGNPTCRTVIYEPRRAVYMHGDIFCTERCAKQDDLENNPVIVGTTEYDKPPMFILS